MSFLVAEKLRRISGDFENQQFYHMKVIEGPSRTCVCVCHKL